MAINPQTKKDVDETRVLIQDTLLSVGARISESIKNSIQDAVDGVDATVLQRLSKSITNNFTSLAKAADDTANNTFRINEGLLTTKTLQKQLVSLLEKEAALGRLKALAELQGIRYKQEDYDATLESIKAQKELLLGEQTRVENIEKQIGLTGKLISSISKIPGIGQFLKADEIDQEMRKAAAQGAGRFKTMGVAAKMVGKQLFDGLLDPLSLITAIWSGFMKVDKAATDFTRITGQNTSAISSMNSSLASTVDILEVASNLSKEIGIAGNNFISPEQLAAVAETKNLLGLSAEQATRLAIQTKMSGQNVATFKSNVMAGVKQSNLQNKTGVEYGVVIKDILDTSEEITMSLGNNPKKLAAAATAARSLGLSLQQVDNIAGSLINFEDSIGNELEAQLLTGKNINLSKARELALNNDLEGVANELAKNGASAVEFSKMNRIQQEGLAKALGMSREQLAKSVLAQEASKNLTDKQRAAVMGMNEAEYERVSVQERIQTSLDKIAQAFAPILEKFVIPIVEVLTKLMNLPLVPYLLLAVVAVRSLGGGIFGAVQGMGSLAKSTLDFVKNLNMKGISDFFGGLKGKFGELKGAFGEGLAGKVQEKVADTGGSITEKLSDKAQDAVAGKAEELGDKVGGAADKTKGLNKGAGAGIKGFFYELGQGFKLFARAMATPTPLGPVGVVMAVSLGVITGAIIGLGWALGLAAPGIEAFGTVVTAAFGGIATLITAVADGFVKIIGAVSMDNIGPMLLLGPALFGIAAGLGAVALAGLAAIPAIGGLVLLSKAAPGLVSLGMGGENKSAGEAKGKGEKSSLEEKIDNLVTELSKNQVINVKVGEKVLMELFINKASLYATSQG